MQIKVCKNGHLVPQNPPFSFCEECYEIYEVIEVADTTKSLPMIRQGDVLLVKVGKLPSNIKPVKRDKGNLILAYGEATGHAHKVDAPPEEATLWTDADNQRFLNIVKDTKLVHEEHTAVHIPAGVYQQVPQQEWEDSKNLAEPERGTTRPVFD